MYSMISSLLHVVCLRPRVYYTLTNFRGGGAIPPPPPPFNTPMMNNYSSALWKYYDKNIFEPFYVAWRKSLRKV